MELYIILSIAVLLSTGLTFLVRRLAIKKAIVDQPNERSSHSIPTPRGGGVAIVISFYLGLVVLNSLGVVPQALFYALLSGVPLAVIGSVDDVIDLSPKIRLIFQFACVGLALYFLGGLTHLQFGFFQITSPYILWPMALLSMVWYINLFNFLDGIDGYASMQAICVAMGILLIIPDLKILALLACSVMGFLIWNWQPAKIFMGDVGSTLLGFILVVFAIYLNNSQSMQMISWLILSSLFWFDASITLFMRWRNKENLGQAHRKHMFQRMNQSGISHARVTLIGFGLNLLFFLLSVLSIYNDLLLLPTLIVSITIMSIYLVVVNRRLPF